MLLDPQLEWLKATSIATIVRENSLFFPLIESIHVLAITLVFGTILIMDLRLIGLASRETMVKQLAQSVLPWTWAAFAIAVLSGGLLFASNAPAYAHNFYFQCKLVLIVLAGFNMSVFHLHLNPNTHRSVADRVTPRSDRIVGVTSMALWIAVIACGRWIGFTMI